MSKVKCEVVKICAVGSYKSFITVRFLGIGEFTFYTPNRDLYCKLKKLGVPTSQALRKKDE